MSRIYVYCEGQTEERFVKTVLTDHFAVKGIYLSPIICRTKEGPMRVFKGGVVHYAKAIKEIKRYCAEHPHEIVTSFMDYYGLLDLPEISYRGGDVYRRIEAFESRMAGDVGFDNFIPYLSLHEFESLLFSDPSKFNYLNDDAASEMENILKSYFDNPELIDNSPATAPSKRILSIYPKYEKVTDGNIIAQDITLPKMMAKCKHFAAWIDKLTKACK